MRKPKLDDIEIQEPPIGELKKKRSCLKSSCLSGCGCLVLILIGLIILLKLTIPETKKIEYLPRIIEQNIPIYDEENIESIELISGKKRSWIIEILAKIPKAIADPILKILNFDFESENLEEGKIFKETYNVIQDSFSEQHDTIVVTWLDLDANPEFITDYYQTELKKKNYKINNKGVFEFTGKEIDGILYIDDNPEKEGTDFVSLTLRFPN